MIRHLLLLAPIILLAACNNSASTTGGDAGNGGSAGAGGGAAGSGGDSTGTGTEDGDLKPPESGVQIATTETELSAGQESYKCWSFELPAGAPFALTSIETQIDSPLVHHYGIFTNTSPDSGKDAYDCEEMGPTWGLVSGGGVGTPPVQFPGGTAMTLPEKTHVILQLHLLNASGDTAKVPPVLVNLNAAKDPTGLEPVGLLITGTLKLNIPAQTSGVEATGGCKLAAPMEHIFAAFPHMHKLGRNISSRVKPADGGPDRMLTDINWDFGDQGLYAVDGHAAAGDEISVTCKFDNPGSTDVKFGLSTTDEMCVQVHYYYPADSMSKYCGFGN